MAEKPILFNTEMVKAILDDRKTQTRRLVKPQPVYDDGLWVLGGAGWSDSHIPIHPVPGHSLWERQPVKSGDILWVRETWATTTRRLIEKIPNVGRHWSVEGEGPLRYLYKAGFTLDDAPGVSRWHPSIHMPREAARLFLRVKNVRMERLQDITEADVQAEGTDMDAWYEYDEWQHQVGDGLVAEGVPVTFETMRGFFGHEVWDRTMQSVEQYEKYGWHTNPWVWVIEFERLDGKPAGLWADMDAAQYADQDVLRPAT